MNRFLTVAILLVDIASSKFNHIVFSRKLCNVIFDVYIDFLLVDIAFIVLHSSKLKVMNEAPPLRWEC